jgi:DNA-binding MarR family transcriptional regulator
MATRKDRRKTTAPKYAAIPNQVFLGVPWKTVRPKYERIIDNLKRSFPIAFVIVGRDQNQDAEDLLEVIKKRLLTSSYAIFDATGGNANVSLEFGFADANDIPRALYLSVHRASRRASKESPIIADLAGKKQNRYAQEDALERLLRQFCQNHAYTKRFEQFLTASFGRRSRGEKKRLRSLALKIVHQLDGEGKARRADVVQNLQADASNYDRAEIDDMIRRMHQKGLVESVQGPYSTVTVI